MFSGDDIKTKKYWDFRKMSELARRIDLHNECNTFKKRIEILMIGKDTFIVDLVKSLKKVTGEWRAWKHQVFGMARSKPYVAAIEQVRELVNWSDETYANTSIATFKSTESYRKFTTNTLKKFLATCKTLEELRMDFYRKIFLPLKDFFNDDAANKYILKLDLLQMQWKQLLAPGAVNSGHFSLESVHFLKVAEAHESFYCFYLILRLIPDLCYKAEKCVTLVRHCLDTDNAKAYNRERKFLLNVWLPGKKKEEQKMFNENLAEHTLKEIVIQKTAMHKLDTERDNLQNRIDLVIKDNKCLQETVRKMHDELQSAISNKIGNEEKYKILNENKNDLESEITHLFQDISVMKTKIKAKLSERVSNNGNIELESKRSLLLNLTRQHEEKNLLLKKLRMEMDETEIIVIKDANREANISLAINNLLKRKERNAKVIEQIDSKMKTIDEEFRHLTKRINIQSGKLHRIKKTR